MKDYARKHIDELYKVGIDIREAESKKRGYSDGIKKILTGLYPDNAHFVFELLQNAEDTGATYVEFRLTKESLTFVHNGQRLFTKEDVDSITNIGDSSKLDDPTKIGKFGIGFKAVFAYTTTPRIYSGDYWFEIRDLICPYPLETSKANSNETLFEFPFNNPQKSYGQCFAEIAKCLRDLKDNVLLFLNNIDSIAWKIGEQENGGLIRETVDNNIIRIKKQHGLSAPNESHWLRFIKDVGVQDDDGTNKSCCIAIAYSIVKNSDIKKEETGWKIVPLNRGEVSIFFPAEKEESNLRFHIHAPFASTVARDSVRDCIANNQLRDHIADLAAESMINIRNMGMLTISFLTVPPVPKDNLSPFYKPIQDKIVTAFMLKELTPLKAGGHKAARSIYKGPAKISELIDDDELSQLIDVKLLPPLWAANAPQQNQREDEFLNSLAITPWSFTALGQFLCNNSRKEFIKLWISKKDDIWLQKFYTLLNQGTENDRSGLWQFNVKNALQSISFVRVFSDKTDNHVIPTEAYFHAENILLQATGISFVKESVYASGKSDTQKTVARTFLESVGVKTFDTKEEIKIILQSYYKTAIIIDNHIKHMSLFISYWRNNHRNCNELFNSDFILSKQSSSDQTLKYGRPSNLCLDSPFQATGLAELTDIHSKRIVWEGYKDKLSNELFADFVNFIKAFGVMNTLKIDRISIPLDHPYRMELMQDYFNKYSTRTSTHVLNEDYDISKLENLIRMKSITSARLIWETLIKADKKMAIASYRPNAQFSPKTADSSLVIALKSSSWIPDAEGIFRKPQDMTRYILRPEFPFDEQNGLLKAIGFGENTAKQQEEYKRDKELLNKFNMTPEIAEELGKSSTEDLLEAISELKRKRLEKENPLPFSPTANPDKREEKAIINAKEAEEKKYEKKTRSVKTTGITKEKKTYLADQNANEYGHIFCQLCHSRMPFAVKGMDHFEAVEFSPLVKKEITANAISLCPNCAAEYKIGCTTSEQTRIEQISALDSKNLDEDKWIIPLELPVHTHIRFFSQKHLIDLQGAIKNHLEDDDLDQNLDIDEDDISFSESPKIINHPVTSPIQANATLQTKTHIQTDISSITDKRVAHAITGMTKLYTQEHSAVVTKASEIIRRFLNHDEFSTLLIKDGIQMTTLKMAIDYLIPGLNIRPLGFSKYPQFIDHVCTTTGCATLCFKPPTEFRICRNKKTLPDSAGESTNTSVLPRKPKGKQSLQGKANVRMYVPPPKEQKL